MSNSSILDDLRYIAEAFMGEARIQCEADLRQFASGLIGAGISPPVVLSDEQLISDYLAARHLVDYGIPISPPAKKTAPVLGGSGAMLVGITTRKPNFDLTGAKLVKRGVLVSWGGCRFKVVRVVAGRAYYGEAFSNSVACGLVQVVA